MKIRTILILEISIMMFLLASFFIFIPSVTFTGVIDEVYDKGVLVHATEGCLDSGRFMLNVSTTTILLDEKGLSLDLSELRTGDTVSIVFFVGVLESDPGIIRSTYRIQIL